MRNSAFNIKGRTSVEGIREKDAEKIMWLQGGGSKGKINKTVQ